MSILNVIAQTVQQGAGGALTAFTKLATGDIPGALGAVPAMLGLGAPQGEDENECQENSADTASNSMLDGEIARLMKMMGRQGSMLG